MTQKIIYSTVSRRISEQSGTKLVERIDIMGFLDRNKIERAYGKTTDCGNAYSLSRYLSNAIRVDESKIIESSSNRVDEGVMFRPSATEKGGIIVFSTDVNAVRQSENKVVDFLKKKIKTIANRLNYTRKVDDIAKSHSLVGWTIGRYLNGRYTSKNGKTFGENSLSLEVIGVDSSTLMAIAEDICKLFAQESVLVKDYTNNDVVFVEP